MAVPVRRDGRVAPVDANVSPWLTERVPYTLARCYVVECGPELLRVRRADASSLSASAILRFR